MEETTVKPIPPESMDTSRLAIKESSVQFMLAEYSRIQEAETFARSSGESRFNIYLTLVSLISAGLLALWQLTSKQSHEELLQFYVESLFAFLFLVIIGLHTFRLFVSRWRLTIIYLRKLARIRAWFLRLDPALKDGLVYGTDETKPSFLSRRFFSASLITLVGLFNCFFLALSSMAAIMIFAPQWASPVVVSLIFAVVAILTWSAQSAYYISKVKALERDRFAAFPEPERS